MASASPIFSVKREREGCKSILIFSFNCKKFSRTALEELNSEEQKLKFGKAKPRGAVSTAYYLNIFKQHWTLIAIPESSRSPRENCDGREKLRQSWLIEQVCYNDIHNSFATILFQCKRSHWLDRPIFGNTLNYLGLLFCHLTDLDPCLFFPCNNLRNNA